MLTRWFPRRLSEETKIEEKLAPFCKVYDLLWGKDDEVTKLIIEREAAARMLKNGKIIELD